MRLIAIPSAKKWASYRIAYLYRFLIYIRHFSIIKYQFWGAPILGNPDIFSTQHPLQQQDIPRSQRSHGGVSIQHVEISIIAYPMQQVQKMMQN
jgi:hypothetical protein